MQPFTEHTGIVVPLDRVNVDTDAIIPKQFLKRIERTGFGEFLFFDWRYKDDGTPNPDFILNRDPYRSGSILLSRANFGCGSSREHAPWALWDYGFRVILAPSYADIFYNNCFKNGMLPLIFSEAQIDDLFRRAAAPTAAKEGYRLKVDLVTQTVTGPDGLSLTFTVDPFRRECLLGGLDDIGLTLRHADKIAAFEKAHAG